MSRNETLGSNPRSSAKQAKLTLQFLSNLVNSQFQRMKSRRGNVAVLTFALPTFSSAPKEKTEGCSLRLLPTRWIKVACPLNISNPILAPHIFLHFFFFSEPPSFLSLPIHSSFHATCLDDLMTSMTSKYSNSTPQQPLFNTSTKNKTTISGASRMH